MKLISPILFLIVAILLFFFVINPFWGDIKQIKADVSTYNIALNNSTELQKTRDSLVNTYKEIKTEDKDRLNHLLPSTVNNIELILEIEKIANLHGMPLKNIKFELKSIESKNTADPNNLVMAGDNPLDNLPYNIFPMEFIIEGKYDTFIEFLKDLESNLRLVDIRDISFNVPQSQAISTGGNIDSSVYSYSLKIQTYWLK